MSISQPVFEAVKALDKRYPEFDRDFMLLQYVADKTDEVKSEEAFERAVVQQCRAAWQMYCSLLLLLANNFGFASAVLARSLYEYVCGARYLMKHKGSPAIFRDFKNYGFKALYESGDVSSWETPKIKAEYQRVKAKFHKNEVWHRKKIRDLADEAGLGKLYGTSYKLLSSVAHADALPAIMAAGLDWRGTDFSADEHFCDISIEFAYMLMEFLYRDANACLLLGCNKEVAILSSLSMKRATAFTASAQKKAAGRIH